MPAAPDAARFSVEPHGRRLEKPWGYEILLSPADAPYTSKLIHVLAGKRLSLQVHDTKVETQTLVDGKGILLLEGPDGHLHQIEMRTGVGYHVAVGQRHRLCAAADQDATIFEASTPEVGLTLRLDDDYGRPDETEQLRYAERASLYHRHEVQALPQATFLLLLEAAVGGTIALFWVHLREEVNRGFTLFTGTCLLVFGGLAVWLRTAFPPFVSPEVDPTAAFWFAVERTLNIAFDVLLAVYLIGLSSRSWNPVTRLLGPLVPLLGLCALWAAALVAPSSQLLGLGSPLAVLAGALALGSALTALSLGHWYLVAPTLSVRPLIQLTFLCLGALVAQIVLLTLLVLLPGPRPERVHLLLSDYVVFFGVRVVFGLLVPLAATLMAWRTARIRSLDSATGLLYVVAALILAGEIAARSLFFLTGIAT